MNALLGIDLGTSSCKTALFAENGRVLSQATEDYSVSYPYEGWAEQDPNDWWGAICRACRRTVAEAKMDSVEIAGVGVDGQSWSAIAVDKEGNVLCPTPIWTDTRAQTECNELAERIGEETLFEVCGNPLKPSYTLPKILWYRKHRPEVYEKTAYILQSNSYIVYCLTGEITQDLSQGYGYSCFDMAKTCWDLDLVHRIGIRKDILPPLFACHQVVGKITAAAANLTGLREGTPVVAGGLDAACGTLGAGVIAPGETQEQGGQAEGMSICMDTAKADERLILGCHVVPGKWLLQGGTVGGGGALKWLKEICCPELSFEEMSSLACDVPPGSDGLLFLPYMAGERSPLWNPDAKGVFFGLNYGKTRGHLIRSVMEGVAFSLRHNLETAEAVGAPVRTLRAMGGSANSRAWTQIKADVTGKIMEITASDTATTLGAAILAGVGTGVYSDFESAVRSLVHVRRIQEPCPDNRVVYDQMYEQYLRLYRQLEPMMNNDKHDVKK